MPYGWEGNRRSGVALVTRHILKWFVHVRTQCQEMEMSSPPTHSSKRYGTLLLLIQVMVPVLSRVDRWRLTAEWMPAGGRKAAAWSRQWVYCRYVHRCAHWHTICISIISSTLVVQIEHSVGCMCMCVSNNFN